MKVEGVIYSAVISGFVMTAILMFYTLKTTGLQFSIPIAKRLTTFSLPLMATGVISFFITFGDRYFLRYYGSLGDIGIYSLAYKFGFLLMFVVVSPFANHWDSEKYQILKKTDARPIFQNIFLVYTTIVSLFVVLLSIFIKDILRIMSDPSFWPAYKIVPVILTAYVFNAWASFTNLGILAKNRTIEITYGTLIGAVAVGIGYIMLIPRFGSMGAAWASVIGFGSRFLWINIRAQTLYNMHLPWGKVLSILLLGIAAYLLSTLGPEKLIHSICYNSMIVIILLSTILFLPILPLNLRRSIKNGVVQCKPSQLYNLLKSSKKSPTSPTC
jgi:O-antigen/teichoic acid export membrane protein